MSQNIYRVPSNNSLISPTKEAVKIIPTKEVDASNSSKISSRIIEESYLGSINESYNFVQDYHRKLRRQQLKSLDLFKLPQ